MDKEAFMQPPRFENRDVDGQLVVPGFGGTPMLDMGLKALREQIDPVDASGSFLCQGFNRLCQKH